MIMIGLEKIVSALYVLVTVCPIPIIKNSQNFPRAVQTRTEQLVGLFHLGPRDMCMLTGGGTRVLT